MNIETLTIAEAREIARLFSQQTSPFVDNPYRVGANYFIRTVTHHYTGTLAYVGTQELVITDAAWIADDGRFSDALKSGEFSEVEPYPNGRVIIGRAAILDASEINSTPRSQK